MVCETIHGAVISKSLSLAVIWAELSKVSIQPQLFIRRNPAALARASDYENMFSLFHKFKEETSKHQAWTHNVKYMAGAHWDCWYQGRLYFCVSMNRKLRGSYREALQFHRPSSAQSSRNSELQRRCPRPIYFLWRDGRQEHTEQILFLVISYKKQMIYHISCLTISHYCYIEGERWRLKSCFAIQYIKPLKEKENRPLSEQLTAIKLYLPNILLSFVEFLSQIFSRCLTGDLNHGQLLAIASHVAGGLTDTVIVVFLYQKVCGWSKSFKNIVITAHNQTNLHAEALGFCLKYLTQQKTTIAAIVHFPWKQIMTEAIIQRGEKSSKRFIWYQWSKTRHKSS